MAQRKPAHEPSGPAPRGQSFEVTIDADRASANRGLSPTQRRFLRGRAHELKALLQVGDKGITRTLVAELDGALEHHELVKVRLAAEHRAARDTMILELINRTQAALVQRIGHVAVIYRPSKDRRRIVLPRA